MSSKHNKHRPRGGVMLRIYKNRQKRPAPAYILHRRNSIFAVFRPWGEKISLSCTAPLSPVFVEAVRILGKKYPAVYLVAAGRGKVIYPSSFRSSGSSA